MYLSISVDYWKSVLDDYKSVGSEALQDIKARKVRSAFIFGGLCSFTFVFSFSFLDPIRVVLINSPQDLELLDMP